MHSVPLTCHIYSQPGLASVPVTLHHLRQEVGFSGPGWVDLGKDWHTLAALWLRAEAQLARLGRPDLEFDEVHKSSLPRALKDWVQSKLLRVDAPLPRESFGNEFTQYLQQLPWDDMLKGDNILEQMWCRTGKSGTLMLIVGLYWQAIFSGGGKKWKDNMDRVEKIFQQIMNAPKL
jgi:hypothetical protein